MGVLWQVYLVMNTHIVLGHVVLFATLENKKKRETFVSLLLVPYDILFSNKYLRDLGRIWELREIVPDPNNMPWIEKIDK